MPNKWNWRENKQHPSRVRSGHQVSCCLISLHFRCDILAPIPVHTESKYEGPLCEPSNNSFLSANCQAQFFSGPPPPFILTRPNIRGFFGRFCPVYVSELIIQHSAKWRTLGCVNSRPRPEGARTRNHAT